MELDRAGPVRRLEAVPHEDARRRGAAGAARERERFRRLLQLCHEDADGGVDVAGAFVRACCVAELALRFLRLGELRRGARTISEREGMVSGSAPANALA